MSRLAQLALLIATLSCGRADPAPAPAQAPSGSMQAAQAPAPDAGLRSRIVELEAQLQDERAQRLEREQEWLHFTQGLGQLARSAGVEAPVFATPLAGEAAAPVVPPAADPERAARARRGLELLAKLRALCFADEVAFDLLEAGEYAEGALGPVVLRELDADGRPYGTLCAERLRLEASRTARTLTFVLEQGYERRGAQRFPFDDPGAAVGEPAADPAARRGTKRIELPEVDPAPWIESLPELFGPASASAVIDDGLHDLTAIRVALNLLLREDASAGWWRLRGLGGVQQGVLRDVALDGFDREGRLERRLFADRLTVLEQSKGVQLVLEQGAQLRGDQKLPFLEDRYRIFLPQASPEAWAKAGVPLVRAPASAAAPPQRD
jgi:hypothetical protein